MENISNAALKRTLSGKRIGNMISCEQLGRGTIGEVVSVQDSSTSIMYAIKSIFNSSASSAILRETEALSNRKLDSPFLLKNYYVFSESGTDHICMEYCEKINLEKYISSQESVVSEKEILRLLAQIVMGLSDLHGSNIIHGNVKLQNILLNSKDEIRIADYGLSSVMPRSLKSSGYIPPEALNEQQLSKSSDVFSLGCVAYFMATKTLPFPTSEKILEGKYSLIDRTDLSPEITDLIYRMIDKDSRLRPTIEDLMKNPTLRSALASIPPRAPPPPPPALPEGCARRLVMDSGSSSSSSSSSSEHCVKCGDVIDVPNVVCTNGHSCCVMCLYQAGETAVRSKGYIVPCVHMKCKGVYAQMVLDEQLPRRMLDQLLKNKNENGGNSINQKTTAKAPALPPNVVAGCPADVQAIFREFSESPMFLGVPDNLSDEKAFTLFPIFAQTLADGLASLQPKLSLAIRQYPAEFKALFFTPDGRSRRKRASGKKMPPDIQARFLRFRSSPSFAKIKADITEKRFPLFVTAFVKRLRTSDPPFAEAVEQYPDEFKALFFGQKKTVPPDIRLLFEAFRLTSEFPALKQTIMENGPFFFPFFVEEFIKDRKDSKFVQAVKDYPDEFKALFFGPATDGSGNSSGGGAAPIPADVRNLFLEFQSSLTFSEIRDLVMKKPKTFDLWAITFAYEFETIDPPLSQAVLKYPKEFKALFFGPATNDGGSEGGASPLPADVRKRFLEFQSSPEFLAVRDVITDDPEGFDLWAIGFASELKTSDPPFSQAILKYPKEFRALFFGPATDGSGGTV